MLIPRALPVGFAVAFAVAAANAQPAVQIGTAFDGPTIADSGFIPPDTMGAVGGDYVVALLNGRYTAYRKSDGAVVATSTLDEFWRDAGTTPDDSYDPRILYDAASQRWFAGSADDANSTNAAFLVAVSKTSNPADGFTGFRIDADSTDQTWGDFPMLGMDAEAVYLSSPAFPVNGPDRPLGNDYLVFPKSDLLAPTPSIANATVFERETLGLAGFQPQPVVNLDGAGPPAKFYAGTLTFLGQIQASQISGPVTAPTFSGGVFIPVDALAAHAPVVQPGTSVTIDGGDSRFSSALVLQNGVTWAVQSVDWNSRAAIRWFQLDPSSDIVLDTGIISDPSLDLYYPSIAVNEADEIVIGMSGSGESQFASAYAVVGKKAGGLTSFGDLILLAEGTATYDVTFGGDRNRWGDYSATVLDPSDPHAFWTFQEFVSSQNAWGVRITQLILVPEPGSAVLLATGLALIARRSRQ